MNIYARARVRLTGSPGFAGTVVRLYESLSSGNRNVGVRWDDPDPAMPSVVLESQLDAIRCTHCGVQQFDNPQADPALDSMGHLCWKCAKPFNDKGIR